jgi:hypothetical protein
MAGFADRKGSLTKGNPVSDALKRLSRLGMNYDDMVLRNSRAVGFTENQIGFGMMNPMGSDADDMYYLFASLSMTDVANKKNISYFDKSYPKKRDQLRNFAVQDEIEDILDTVTDEAIVFDETNYFAYPVINTSVSKEVKDSLIDSYNKIYEYFGFSDGQSGWNYFRKWLVDGYLAFEIIYDDEQRHIIGFKELDPVSLMPAVDKESGKKIWIQYKGGGPKERMLFDSQVIYLAYSSVNSPSRVSYVERLIRSFNLLRIMEHSRIIWAVTNASFKMKFVIPVGGKSKTRAKQSLAQLMNNYRELVNFDMQSGEIQTNGKPMMQFHKEYWLPSKDGEQPEIDTLANDGPQLSDTESLQWFYDKLKLASKIPFSRFDKDSPATYEMAAEGMNREEIKFAKFINRLRSIFQEILVKPIYLQICLDYPELEDDTNFKGNLTIKYNKDNVFEELKQMELASKRIDFISQVRSSLTEQDKDMNEVPFFSLNFLIKKYGGFTEEDLKKNKKMKEIDDLVKQGYTKEDAEKIADGADPDKFKKVSSDMEDANIDSAELGGDDAGGAEDIPGLEL